MPNVAFIRRVGTLLAVLVAGSCSSATMTPNDGATDSDAQSTASVGQRCTNPAGSPPPGALISSPDPGCPSRICLVEPTRSTCTASCSSDSDCQGADTTQCAAGFGCAVAVTAGPFACRKLCICRDDIKPTPSCP